MTIQVVGGFDGGSSRCTEACPQIIVFRHSAHGFRHLVFRFHTKATWHFVDATGIHRHPGLALAYGVEQLDRLRLVVTQ